MNQLKMERSEKLATTDCQNLEGQDHNLKPIGFLVKKNVGSEAAFF
jgi:hypothetical protein